MKPQLLKKRYPQQSEDDDYANYVALLSEFVSLRTAIENSWLASVRNDLASTA